MIFSNILSAIVCSILLLLNTRSEYFAVEFAIWCTARILCGGLGGGHTRAQFLAVPDGITVVFAVFAVFALFALRVRHFCIGLCSTACPAGLWHRRQRCYVSKRLVHAQEVVLVFEHLEPPVTAVGGVEHVHGGVEGDYCGDDRVAAASVLDHDLQRKVACDVLREAVVGVVH
jgi:hypothetical protein